MQFAIPCLPKSPNPDNTQRHHGLDALRGIAAILVVLLHAGIPYMTNPLAYLVWPARDAHPSPFVDALTWCTECFLMPLFFLLAGFFSIGMLVSRGEKKFIEGRTRRLMVTQVAAGSVILPACLIIWSLGWVADGLYVPRDIWNTGIPAELESELYGFGHFWFLHYLYIYCLVLCGVSWLIKQWVQNRPAVQKNASSLLEGVDVVLVSVWKPMIPAIPCALILFLDARIVLGFYQTFIPVGSKLAYYAIYFLVGTSLWRHRDSLHVHARHGKTYLFLATMTFLAVLPQIHQHLREPLVGARLALLAGLLALFASLTSYGLFAVSLNTRCGDNATMKFLAEASFWVYIIHLPFVGLAQVAVAQTALPALAKFLLVGSIGVFLSLTTYHAFVRKRWLGAFLEGQWRPRPANSAVARENQVPQAALESTAADWNSRRPSTHFLKSRPRPSDASLYQLSPISRSGD